MNIDTIVCKIDQHKVDLIVMSLPLYDEFSLNSST